MSRPMPKKPGKVPMPQGPKVKNPMKVLKRLIGIIFKKYKIQMILVFALIVLGVFSNVQGTLFIQSLIDDYINPMLSTGSKDFTPLVFAILRVAGLYLLGAAATYTYSRIMVYVTQG
ncbi:MAG: ABC transporter ATP-binding protein, partial [Ruminococcus sp.]|nr:ABC transporter ATP-binding protein [Ruminococcus sp.]